MLSSKLTASSGVRVTPFGGSATSARRARPAGSVSQPSWVTKGSFLVEVEVGEVEPEDQAIQRFQRAVTQTLVINELRRRRRVMTKIEALQAKQNEKGLIKKLNIDPPSWKDTYGESLDPAPFVDYFVGDGDYSEIASNASPLDDEAFFLDAQENMYGGGSQSGFAGGAYSQFPGQYGSYGNTNYPNYSGYPQDSASYYQQPAGGFAAQPDYGYQQPQGEFAQPDYTQQPQQPQQGYGSDYAAQPPAAAPGGEPQPGGY